MVSMAKIKSGSAATRLARWRVWVQAGFLLAWLDPLLLRMHTVCGPVFHCYSCPLAAFACPIGVLANFSALHVFPFAAIGTLVVVGAIFGSFVCGWACPFGFLQDLVARVPTPKFVLPAWTGWCRYAVLAGLVLIVPYLWGEGHWLFICRVCPAGAVEAALPYTAQSALNGGPIVWPSAVKSGILLVFVGAMFFAWRPWCTLLCPLGAIYSIFNRFSVFFLRFQRGDCVGCDKCRSLCKGGHRPQQRVDGLQCVRCLECTNCRAVTVQTLLSSKTATS
jgi:ferredoxin-type protein NapH